MNKSGATSGPIEDICYARVGHDALWLWFGLSRASWLTMPRTLMHAMPDDWQMRMAQLCAEWDDHWSFPDDCPDARVMAVDGNRFTKWPDELLNYRHPSKGIIDRYKTVHIEPTAEDLAKIAEIMGKGA